MRNTTSLTTTIAGMLQLQLADTLLMVEESPAALRSLMDSLSLELGSAESAGFHPDVSEAYDQAASTAREASQSAADHGFTSAARTLRIAAGRLERASWFVGAHAA